MEKSMSEEMKDVKQELAKAEQEYIKETNKEVVNVYYSDEEMKDIVGNLAFSSEKYVYCVPDCFKNLPEEKRPIFKFLAMNGELQEDFYDFVFSVRDKDQYVNVEDGISLIMACRSNKAIRKWLLENMLVGWRNYRNIDGVEIEYSKETLHKVLPITAKMELAELAITSTFLKDSEKLSLEF